MITAVGGKLTASSRIPGSDRVTVNPIGRACLVLGVLLAALATRAAPPDSRLAAAEALYADWVDANYAALSLAAGPMTELEGRDRAAWERLRIERAARLGPALDGIDAGALKSVDARALVVMRRAFADPPAVPAAAAPGQSAALCDRAAEAAANHTLLSRALYACFEEHGNHVAFEGRSIVRSTALELLAELDTSERRRALFAALGPLWLRINANDEPGSPYRRLIALAGAKAKRSGTSPIREGAGTVGATEAQAEHWLIEVLEAWRTANPGPALEPWDYWHHYAGAVAPLDALIPPTRVLELSKAYYRDLGADLDALGVLHDLEVRPGKAPLAYADFVRTGRRQDGTWRPAIARVSANVEHGGLFVLNEIVHEDGHAVHMAAVRTRPAFFDLGDDLYLEAFADVTSWNVADPRWQQRYLGTRIDEHDSLRALFGNVMLDVAWGLFEARMLHAPTSDPNAVWTEITSRYLNIRPHPELSWWALRVQLVDVPGYMINYGLGAILTADIRARTRAGIGEFSAGNPRWYRYTSAALLRHGAAIETPALLRQFLGRPVSDAALLREIARIGKPAG